MLEFYISLKEIVMGLFFFFSSRRRHTRFDCDWSSDVCSSDLCPTPSPPTSTPATTRRPARHRGDRPSRRQCPRSEERRVGKECRSRWSPHHYKKKKYK